MRITVTGLDDIIRKLTLIETAIYGTPMFPVPLAIEEVFLEALGIVEKAAIEILNQEIYDNPDRPPFADVLKRDLLTAFEPQIVNNIAILYHTSLSGPFLEFGTEGHQVPFAPEPGRLMVWRNPEYGYFETAEKLDISGVTPIEWFSTAFQNSISEIVALFGAALGRSLSVIVRS